MANKFKASNTTTVAWYFDGDIGTSDIKVSIYDCQKNLKYETYLSDGKIMEGTVTVDTHTYKSYTLVITSIETKGWTGDLQMYFLLTDHAEVPTVNGGQTSITLPFEITPDTANIK